MKYISLDIETTGLNHETCQLLSLGVIIEDTEKKLPYNKCPKFYAIINHEFIKGEPFALNMNADLIDAIAAYTNSKTTKEQRDEIIELHHDALFCSDEVVLFELDKFLRKHGFNSEAKLVAGANVKFDLDFLSKLPGYRNLNIGRRTLEPSHYTIDWKNDTIMPSLFQCKERLGLEGGVIHHALADAWDVIQVLRTQY